MLSRNMEDASHHGAAVDTIIIDSDCDDDGTVHQNRMRSNELGDSSGTSLLYLNDEILASIFLWLLGPEDVAYRHILPMCSASSTLSGMDIAGVDEGQSNNKVEVGDDDNDEAMPQGHQEEALDNHHGQHNGPVSHRATLENSSTPVGAVLTGREILRSLCNRTRNIIDSLCGVLTIRVKDLVESAVISDSPTIAPATLPNRITCQNYIFDFTGIHSTSLRGPLNTIVNFINTTTYTQGLPPSRMAAATLLTPPARVHLLNINPWMLEPSSRCIRDVFGVVRDIEENNKKSCCFPQRMMDDISYNHSMLIDSSSSSSFPSRRITISFVPLFESTLIILLPWEVGCSSFREVVRMTLCGFIIHQQELPPLKITLNNLRSLSLAYCTIPLTGLHAASPDTVRQVPWLPSMPMLESLELRHMVAVDSSGMMSLGHGLPILSIGDSVGLPDALLEGILHRIPNLRDLLIDSSASIMCPDIASNAPKLEHLAISHCPRLRPSSIEKVAKECTRLKLLDIRTLTQLANEVNSHALAGIESLRLPPAVREEYLKSILSHQQQHHHAAAAHNGYSQQQQQPPPRGICSLSLSEVDDIDLTHASLQTLFISRSESMPLPSLSSLTASQYLRHLFISFCRLDPARFRISGTFSSLEILSLHNVVYSRDQLSVLLASTPSLTALSIALCDLPTTRQRDNNAPRDELEPLRVPGSNPPIPLKFPHLKYLHISGSKRVHYSAIVPSIVSNADVLEQLELLKVSPVYSISSPSPRLSSITVSLLPPTPSTRVRLIRDILNESTAIGGHKLLLQHHHKSEVDLFVAALTRQCWSMKSLVLAGCCLQSPPTQEEAYPTTQQTMKIVREYEALLGGGESGRDTRLSIVRDSINNGMVNQKRSLAPSSKATRDHEVHDSTQGEQPANEDDEKDSDDTGSVDDYRRLSNGDDLMLDLIIELTTAVALGLLARLVAVNEIMYSNYQQHQQHARGASATHSTLETFPTPVSPPILHRPDLSGIHMDDDDDDDEVSSPLVEIPSPTPRNPPSTDRRQPFIPPPPPPLISIVPPLPAMHTIQQLLLVHRMPMSGLELDAPSGSTQWDSSYKETMAVLISAPVKMAFEVLAGDNKSMDWGREGEEEEEEGKVSGVAADDRHNKEPVMDGDDGDPMSSSLVDARHRAVYEYGKAYQSMIDKFMSMRTAQVTVMSQLPERQQQQLLWKGLLIQSTGAFSREGAYSTKILTYRKTLLKYKESPGELREYLSTRKLVNKELAALLSRRLACVPESDRWGARCRSAENRESDIIAGCLRNALTPAGVIGGGVAILPLREGASYLPKLFDDLPVHLAAPLLVHRLTSPSHQYAADVGLVSQFGEFMEMCISMCIRYDTIELKYPGYHVLQTAIAKANALDRSTREPLPAFPTEQVADDLPLIRVGVAMVSSTKAELEVRKRPCGEASSQRRKTAVHRLLMSLAYGRLACTPMTRLEDLSIGDLLDLLRASINHIATSLLRLRSGTDNTTLLQGAYHTSIQDPPWWNGSLESMKLKYSVVSRLASGNTNTAGGEHWALEAFEDLRSKFPNLVVLQVELPEAGLSKLHDMLEEDIPSSNGIKSTKVVCSTLLPRVRTLLSPHGGPTCDEDSEPPPPKRPRLTERCSSEGSQATDNRLQRYSSDISVATTTRVSQIGVRGPTPLHFNSVDTEWYRATECCTVADNLIRLQSQQQQHPCWDWDAFLS